MGDGLISGSPNEDIPVSQHEWRGRGRNLSWQGAVESFLGCDYFPFFKTDMAFRARSSTT
jgi:hypothetical protein